MIIFGFGGVIYNQLKLLFIAGILAFDGYCWCQRIQNFITGLHNLILNCNPRHLHNNQLSLRGGRGTR